MRLFLVAHNYYIVRENYLTDQKFLVLGYQE